MPFVTNVANTRVFRRSLELRLSSFLCGLFRLFGMVVSSGLTSLDRDKEISQKSPIERFFGVTFKDHNIADAGWHGREAVDGMQFSCYCFPRRVFFTLSCLHIVVLCVRFKALIRILRCCPLVASSILVIK